MYGVALAAAIELGKRELVPKMLNDLKEDFVDLSKVKTEIFQRIVRTAVKLEQHDLLMALLDYMHEVGVSSSACYTTAVKAAFQEDQYALVPPILRYMNERSLDASSEYLHALRSSHKAGRMAEFLLICIGMCDCDYNLGIAQYKTAVTEAVNLNKHDAVLDICSRADADDVDSECALIRFVSGTNVQPARP